ncbi:MAG: PepSY domain-containing protein [Xanthomonadales bacterium]|nr:PepSY domain-containing protein [Xanthomonadales bacterium]
MKSISSSAPSCRPRFQQRRPGLDDCSDPVADWQPREALRQQLEQHGWTAQRIKVDDGCYEVRGIDKIGNAFKAKYAPASLRIRNPGNPFRPGRRWLIISTGMRSSQPTNPSATTKPSGE